MPARAWPLGVALFAAMQLDAFRQNTRLRTPLRRHFVF
jgi:hypothetical protein